MSTSASTATTMSFLSAANEVMDTAMQRHAAASKASLFFIMVSSFLCRHENSAGPFPLLPLRTVLTAVVVRGGVSFSCDKNSAFIFKCISKTIFPICLKCKRSASLSYFGRNKLDFLLCQLPCRFQESVQCFFVPGVLSLEYHADLSHCPDCLQRVFLQHDQV